MADELSGSSNGQIVDWNEALHSCNGDRRLLRDIVEAFLDESPRLLSTIRGAIEKQDAKTLQRAAHYAEGLDRVLRRHPAPRRWHCNWKRWARNQNWHMPRLRWWTWNERWPD